jgi:hypothetical protein
MTLEEHATHLGGLISNFQSLEFLLRAFLQKSPSASPLGIPHGVDIYSSPVGTDLPENELTNYDSLGQLIDKYNGKVEKLGLAPIDKTLVEIRDALAHGRVSAALADDTLRLVKFSKPANGRVRITFNAVLSSDWFTAQKKRVFEAMQSVHRNVR